MTSYNYLESIQSEVSSLQDLVERGILSKDDANRIMAEKKEQREAEYAKEIERRLADVHTAPITKGTGADKRWRTRIIRDNGKSRQIAKTSVLELEKALYKHYYQTLPPSHDVKETIESLFPVYIEKQKKRKRAVTTIDRYRKDWKNHCLEASFIHKPVTDLTIDELEAWALSLIHDKGMGRTNYYNITGIIRGILDVAVKRNLIRQNPWGYVDPGNLNAIDARRKYEHKSDELEGVDAEVLSASEMTLLKNYAWKLVKAEKRIIQNPFELLAVIFTLEQGLRVSELCALKHSDFRNSTTIHIQRMLRDQGTHCREVVPHTKGYRDRVIPLSESSKEAIGYASYLQKKMGISSDYIFSRDENPLPYRAPGRALTILCRELGIQHRHIHSIRKTVTTVLVDSGCYSPATIAKLMGNSVDVIYKYYYFNREDMDSICRSYNHALDGLFDETSSDNYDDKKNK